MAPNGVYAYDPADDQTAIVSDYAYQIGGNTVFASIPLASLGLAEGQSVAVSAFRKGFGWLESGLVGIAVLNINRRHCFLHVADAAGTWETAVETFPNWVPGWLGSIAPFNDRGGDGRAHGGPDTRWYEKPLLLSLAGRYR